MGNANRGGRRSEGAPLGVERPMIVISASESRERCLQPMDRVQRERTEVVITKHDKPVAKLVPAEAAMNVDYFGALGHLGPVVWFWFREGDRPRLGPRCIDTLNDACGAGRMLVSAVSFREIGQFENRKLVQFQGGAREWLRKAIEVSGIALADLDARTLREREPGRTHPRPWDQLLVETNTRLGTTFVTRDRVILRYTKRWSMPVLDARR